MRRAGLTTSLDTNDDPANQWQGPVLDTLREVDIFMPNERELLGISGECDFERAVHKLSQIVPTLVVKRGSAGAIAMHKGRRYSVPAIPIEILDAVGAGDSFNSGFLHAHLNGGSIVECLEFGNLCGACSTTASGGTQAFSNSEHMLRFFARHKQSPASKTSLSSAAETVILPSL